MTLVLNPQMKLNIFTSDLTRGPHRPFSGQHSFVGTKVQLICEERPRHLQGSTCSTCTVSPVSLFPLTRDNTRPGSFTSSHSSCYTTTQGKSGHESARVVGSNQVKAVKHLTGTHRDQTEQATEATASLDLSNLITQMIMNSQQGFIVLKASTDAVFFLYFISSVPIRINTNALQIISDSIWKSTHDMTRICLFSFVLIGSSRLLWRIMMQSVLISV